MKSEVRSSKSEVQSPVGPDRRAGRPSEVRSPGLEVRVLTGFFERMRGLLGRDGLPEGEVFVFPHCGSVHTFGMRFAIDVVFLDRDGRVLSIRENVRPGRVVFGGWKADATVEAQTGWLPRGLTLRQPFWGACGGRRAGQR